MLAGDLIWAETSDTALEFSYTPRRLLAADTDDAAGITINYSYDAGGRNVRITDCLGTIETRYSYGRMGEIRMVTFGREATSAPRGGGPVARPNGPGSPSSGKTSSRGTPACNRASGGRITVDDDASLRETERRFGGRMLSRRIYDGAGRLAGVVHQRDTGMIGGDDIDAEASLYDEDGRRRYTIDEDCGITRHSYHAAGRLASVRYPINDRIIRSYLDQLKGAALLPPLAQADQLVDRGPDDLTGPLTIPAGDRALIDGAYLMIIPIRIGSPSRPDQSWGESFTYDERGNRTRLGTPLGAIEYDYDAGNRLTAVGELSLAYDAAGNMVYKAGPSEALRYKYNVYNRVVGTCGQTPMGTHIDVRYGYDALGRRTVRRQSEDTGSIVPLLPRSAGVAAAPAGAFHTIYDGFSVDAIATMRPEAGVRGRRTRTQSSAPRRRSISI